MKIGRKGFVALAAIVGLLGAGSIFYQKDSIMAQEGEIPSNSEIFASPLDVLADDVQEPDPPGISKTDYSGEKDLTGLVTAEVSNWAEFATAFSDPTVEAISIIQSFAIPERPRDGLPSTVVSRDNINDSSTSRYVTISGPNSARKLVIEGNDNAIDFGAVGLTFTEPAVFGDNNFWDITWQNLDVYHGNIYGFITFNDMNDTRQQASLMTYHNVRDVGSQIIHSPQTDVVISGNTSSHQELFFDSGLRTEPWESDDQAQINLYITNLTVLDGATFDISTLRAGNVHLRGGGSMYVGRGATVNAIPGQNDDTGEGDASHTNFEIAGSLILKDGATMNLTPKPQYGSLYLTGRDATVDIGKQATININSTGHTNNSSGSNRSLISLAAGSKLTVNEEGSLNVNATGMGSSNSDIIYVSGAAEFTVQRKGIFDVKSDSTSNSQRLINIRNANSVFRFADAQRVNLERTATIAGTSNGLIEISGSSGYLDVDIQKVSRWDQGNLTDTPTKVWTPMYGMQIVYNTRTSTVREATSLTEEAADTFKSEFKTDNTQRVLFEYIPDVNISINSVATDNVNDDSSYVIRGNTNPGAYVRIWDEPVNDTVEAAMDPADNAIASPAEMASPKPEDPDFTSNFTLQADPVTGNFEYTIPSGKKLVAEGKVKVFAFLEGKYDEAEQTILDATAPTADPKPYIISVGDAAPDPSLLVENVQDTNPLEQTFTYAYADPDAVNALLNTPSEEGHNVDIIVYDNAGNGGTITSKLIIWDLGEELKGEDFSVKSNDVSGKTEDELKELVRDKGKLSAFKLFEGAKVDLTDRIDITDLGGLAPTPGDYTVTLSVAADPSIGLDAPLSATLVVTVSDDVPPTGTGKPTLVPLGKPEYITGADLKKFLSEYSDNVSANEDITAALVDPDGIADLVATIGDKTMQITLTDEAGNTSDPIDIPITVIDGEVNGNVAIEGSNFVTDRADWEAAADLKTFIVNQANVIASEMTESGLIDVTDTNKLTIDTTGVTVDSEHEETAMDIILTVSNGVDEVSKTITVTFNDKTAPTADPAENIRVPLGVPSAITGTEASPKDPRDFITNLKDNVSAADDITVTLDMTTQEIEDLVATVGTKNLKIKLTDEKNNSQTIEVPITVFDNSLTVRFVDSGDNDIVPQVMLSGHAPGDTVDLTQEKEVTDSIAAAVAKDYTLVGLDGSEAETAVEVTDNGKVVKYIFDGTLIISSHPTTLDFGVKNVGVFNIRVNKPTFEDPLVIKDNRAVKSDWELTARLEKVLTLQDGATDDPNYRLPDALKYQTGADETTEITLNSGDQIIETGNNGADEEYRVSDYWAEDGKGFKLDVPAGTVNKLGEYKAEIVWTLSDTR